MRVIVSKTTKLLLLDSLLQERALFSGWWSQDKVFVHFNNNDFLRVRNDCAEELKESDSW